MRTDFHLAMALASSWLVTTAHAQVRPQAGLGDQRIQRIVYQADQVFLLEAAPGYQLLVELAPDEQIESVAVGDSAAWQVTTNRAGNMLFVKVLEAGADTNMTVITSVRRYVFDLIAQGGQGAPYTVRFDYPASDSSDSAVATAPLMVGRYRLSGSRDLRPIEIGDDGTQTYIIWGQDAALPATYLLDDAGRETLANGMMRDHHYVLDGIAPRLVFRLDKQVARARRLPPETEARP